MIRLLREEGVKINESRTRYTKKTFDVDLDLLGELNYLRNKLELSMREAFNEAIYLWVKSKREELAGK